MSYTLGLYEKSMPDNLTWEQKLSQVSAGGFDFLEISVDESEFRMSRLDWNKEQRREVVNAVNSTNVKIDTMCLSGHRKYPMGSAVPETHAKSVEILDKAINLAYDIGVRIIQLAAYDVYYNETPSIQTREIFLETVYKGSRMAAKNGIILAFETMENDFCNTIEKAMYFVGEVNSPYLKVYPDVGNITNGTDDIVRDIKSGEGHIAAAHLKETVAGVFRDMRFGEGRVDFSTAATTLNEVGVRKFTAEFWYKNGDDYKKEIKHASEFLRPILDL